MAKPGRRSAASMSVVATGSLAEVKRPKAPAELTPEQASEWNAVVRRLAADWFPRETHGLLTSYVRHVVAARRIGEMISALGDAPADVDAFDQLLRMQERESRAISSLATRMRISQQSLIDKSREKPDDGPKPWETKENQ